MLDVSTATPYYFVTLVCHQRQPLLADPAAKKLLLRALREAKERLDISIAGYALLDDHLHLVIQPGQAGCDSVVNYIRALCTRTCRAKYPGKWQGPIWKREYRSQALTTAEALRAHLDFVHYDPVRHLRAEMPAEYPWTSLRARIRAGLYPENWASFAPPASIVGLIRDYDLSAFSRPDTSGEQKSASLS